MSLHDQYQLTKYLPFRKSKCASFMSQMHSIQYWCLQASGKNDDISSKDENSSSTVQVVSAQITSSTITACTLVFNHAIAWILYDSLVTHQGSNSRCVIPSS
ncbi:hypothetical protein FRX31_016901 [Thalictrum thalictroides]|uniref:Uncharacterized protein n=1 Tax=Thalictrum thalictroides TaxID=46969 RepID=A0A7J6W9C7_THATH|nr:hypothetical protein FRX31_016901 [Thalictrum thalictroides]